MTGVLSGRSRGDSGALTRIRGAGAYNLADQVVSSGANFMLGVLVARVGGPHDLGVFGLVWLVWLAVLGVNRALVCEPMTVHGSLSGDAQRSEGASAAIGVGLLCAIAFAAVCGLLQLGGMKDAIVLLALVPWIPALLLQDYFRMLSFRLGRPDHALVSDLVFLVVQLVVVGGLLFFDITGLYALLASWGLGACAGAAYGIAKAGLRLRMKSGSRLMCELWSHSRWFVAEFWTRYIATNGYMLVLPILLTVADFGLFRSGIGLIGPLMVIFIAGGNVGLPGCVRSLRQDGQSGLDRYTARLTLAVAAFTLAYCGLVALAAPWLLTAVYGVAFAGAAEVTRLLAVAYMLSSLAFGCGVALKALNEMRKMWLIRVLSTVAATVAAIPLVSTLDLGGAGLIAIILAGSSSVTVLICYVAVSRNNRSIAIGGSR